jgi:hypothetical protein
MTISLDALTPIEVQERLRAFDFDVGLGQGEPSWCSIDGVERPEVIARDGSGGEFIALAPSHRVLWVSSEGEATVIAADLEELVNLVVVCPYWRDLLRFSSISEMRQVAPKLEQSWLDEEEEFGEFREFLKMELRLPDQSDPIGRLYQAISTSDVVVRGPDGSICSLRRR